MRLLLSLLLAASPLSAAQLERPLPALPRPVALPAPTVPALLPPALPAQTPTTPSVARPEIAAQVPLSASLESAAAQVSADAAALPKLSGEGASAAGAEQIRRLTGEAGIPAAPPDAAGPDGGAGGLVPTPPSPPGPPRKKDPAVSRMIRGTMAFKLGMEAMTTSVPFVAMKALGGATAVALLVVVTYGIAQAVAGSFSGALTDRFRANRVLSAAVLAQGAGAAALVTASLFMPLGPGLLFPVYALIGAAVGVAETSRRVIPPLLVGQDAEALRTYNARLHRFYETAGVAGSALAGLLIWKLGALHALWVTPPAAFVAGLIFRRVAHPFSRRAPAPGSAGPLRRALAALKAYAGDLRLGARAVFKDSRMRWVALAMVAPQIVHRVFENLLLPVYAKGVLGHEALSAALLTASNAGELLGASLLLRWAARFKGPASWVRWASCGLLASWALSAAPALGLPLGAALPLLLPLILVFSMTWAASHLSLESDVQERVPQEAQPRVIGLLNGLFIAGAALAVFLIGRLLDALPLAAGFAWINAGFAGLAVLIWLASRALRRRAQGP